MDDSEGKPEILLEVDLGTSNGVMRFTTGEQLQEFITEQLEAWSWLSTPSVNQVLSSPWSTISRSINQINQFLPRLNQGEQSVLAQIKSHMESAFSSTRIPITTSPVFHFIEEQKSESLLTAAAALATWMNLGGVDITKIDQLKGALLMAAHDVNLTPKSSASVKRSLEQLNQKYLNALSRVESEIAAHQKASQLELVAHRERVAIMMNHSRRRLIAFRKGKRRDADAALKSIRDTENLYKEQMGIKAPVEYWKGKAESHRTSSATYRENLLWFALIGGGGLLWALYMLADHAIAVASADKPPAVYFILATFGVVLTTIGFWSARVLTRLYMSEHHLAIDADERAVMAQTYLALTAQNQATDKERQIVLMSLFRPTADGIVRDDGAPDFSPAALLSRIGSK